MQKKLCAVLVGLMTLPLALLAQQAPQATSVPSANPITMSERGLYGFMSAAVIRAAEKMPEENYSFKPTPEVRSFGQLVGHVADANFMFCSLAVGEANPAKRGFVSFLFRCMAIRRNLSIDTSTSSGSVLGRRLSEIR